MKTQSEYQNLIPYEISVGCALAVLQHLIEEFPPNRAQELETAQDLSTFAVSEVSDETPVFFQALPECQISEPILLMNASNFHPE